MPTEGVGGGGGGGGAAEDAEMAEAGGEEGSVPPPPPTVAGAAEPSVPTAPPIVSEAVASVAARASELPQLPPCAVPSLGLLKLGIRELEERLRQASVAWSGCPPSVRAAWEVCLRESMHPIECACCLRVMDAHAPTLARARGASSARAAGAMA